MSRSSEVFRSGKKLAVIITRPDDTEVEYESQSAAAKVEPIFQTYISKMCRGQRKMYAGYKARFKEAKNDIK